MPQMILDSHVHLWPASAANPQAHKWMVEGAHLTRQFLVDDYLAAANSLKARDVNVSGFIYVETDRVVGEYDPERPEVETWATEPLREIALLRRIVEGEPEAGQTSNGSHADLLKGIVAWAPCDKGFVNFLHYLNAAAETARPETWSRIKGFRFLVQGMRDEEDFRQLPELPSFTKILRYMGMQGYSFDVGVDQRQGGVWQLEGFADVVEAVHRWIAPEDQTVFILNHLCKPDMEQSPTTNESKADNFERWKVAISRFAKQEKVYMKLSGAFSEIADQDPETPLTVLFIVERMKPWLDHVFSEFGPARIMFGSDWPVCNVRGPGDAKSWGHWVEVVEEYLQTRGLLKDEMDRVWYGTAVEAYKLSPLQ